MYNNAYKLVLLASTFMVASQSYAMTPDVALQMQVDRYSTVNAVATPAQLNPLLTMAQFTFPPTIATIGDAVHYVLLYSGYALAPSTQQSHALITILSEPLPLVDKQVGPMTVKDALLILVGKNIFTLQTDPINRLVNFKLIASINKNTLKLEQK